MARVGKYGVKRLIPAPAAVRTGGFSRAKELSKVVLSAVCAMAQEDRLFHRAVLSLCFGSASCLPSQACSDHPVAVFIFILSVCASLKTIAAGYCIIAGI